MSTPTGQEPESDPLDSRGGDAPPPASPGRRRFATILAFLFIALIVSFLVWFVSTHTERSEGGGFFGELRAEVDSSLL